MYKYEIPIFVWERDFSDVIKYVHNKQVISPTVYYSAIWANVTFKY